MTAQIFSVPDDVSETEDTNKRALLFVSFVSETSSGIEKICAVVEQAQALSSNQRISTGS